MAEKKNLLIYVVEDNQIYNHLVCENLKKRNYTNIRSFTSGRECVKAVSGGGSPDIVIQDYFLEEGNGVDVLKNVKKICKKTEFIFLTGNENMEVAVATIKYGAYDYIIKDKLALDKVANKIERISHLTELEKRNEFIQRAMIVSVIILVLIVLFAIFHFFV